MSEAASQRDIQRDSQRERVIQAAFDLFGERGYGGTTVEDIAARAGVGRTTFFRMFRSKESVVFPAHDALLTAIEARLATVTPGAEKVALFEASGLVLNHYLAEGQRARQRYALTREVETLRERERASIFQYERLFRRFIHQWWGGGTETLLRAEVTANAVVTAHNHVLRAWLRGAISAEEAVPWFREVIMELDSLLAWYEEPDAATPAGPAQTGNSAEDVRADGPDGGSTTATGDTHDGRETPDGAQPAVIVVRDAKQFNDLIPRIQQMLD